MNSFTKDGRYLLIKAVGGEAVGGTRLTICV